MGICRSRRHHRRPIPGATEIGEGNADCKGRGSQWDEVPHRSARSSRMRSASTTWPATSGNGCRTAITITTPGRLRTVRRGPVGDCNRRVVRGGSSNSPPQDIRSARRYKMSTDTRDTGLGFPHRQACSPRERRSLYPLKIRAKTGLESFCGHGADDGRGEARQRARGLGGRRRGLSQPWSNSPCARPSAREPHVPSR